MRSALIVGLNKYQNVSSLSGCVNDARAMQRLAILYGYSRIVTLTDNQATKANITETLADLIDRSDGNDHILYYHSGHGTQMKDKNGDEADGMDEVLCNYDFSNNNALRDDDLAEAIKDLGEMCTLHIMIDTCNSGTMSELAGQKSAGAHGWRTDGSNKPRHPKTLPISDELREWAKDRPLRKFGIKPAGKGAEQRHTLLAACKAKELSWEYKINGEWRGLMTKSFELKTQVNKKHRNLKWQQAYARTRKLALSENKNQHAQLEGEKSLKQGKIFGGAHNSWLPSPK